MQIGQIGKMNTSFGDRWLKFNQGGGNLQRNWSFNLPTGTKVTYSPDKRCLSLEIPTINQGIDAFQIKNHKNETNGLREALKKGNSVYTIA